MNSIISIRSISELHQTIGLPKPKHPLISIVDLTNIQRSRTQNLEEKSISVGLYSISLKKIKGYLKYGRGYYDFSEGSLVFMAPNQVITYNPDLEVEEGWGLYFHPDFIYSSVLGQKITEYSFFHYDLNEALHVSEEEKAVVNDCIRNIEKEYSQNIDQHTHSLLISNLELLLNYCNRFYGRQFYTREKVNSDLVQRFEKELIAYFASDALTDKGLPDVKYFAAKLALSPNYLSDVLKRFTGKATQEHIHLYVVDKAKSILMSTEKSISEVAYYLGFEHPSHFNKLFKMKTGKTPSDFRQLN
jgi:AraC-like DNA-binding protein